MRYYAAVRDRLEPGKNCPCTRNHPTRKAAHAAGEKLLKRKHGCGSDRYELEVILSDRSD